MQLKEFKKTLQAKAALISDTFLEQKKTIPEGYGYVCSINTDLKIYYDSNKEQDIQYLKEVYAYFEILREQRKDLPYNIHELSFYEYKTASNNGEMYDFLQHNSLDVLEQKMLRNWYYLFDCRGRSTKPGQALQFYNKIFLNPSYEQYQRHYVTHLILEHIYSAKYAIGVTKDTLSLYEQAVINKIKPFKNLEYFQMEVPFHGWLFNSKTAYNRLNKLFEKEPHIKIGFEKIAHDFNFPDLDVNQSKLIKIN